uniref:hypothetical protein n=1 Tax=Pseudomonas viridiflava TaxID=33069 RepID=UPI0019D00061
KYRNDGGSFPLTVMTSWPTARRTIVHANVVALAYEPVQVRNDNNAKVRRVLANRTTLDPPLLNQNEKIAEQDAADTCRC